MNLLRINLYGAFVIGVLLHANMACSTKTDSASEELRTPVIDFKAMTDLENQNADFNQILLRVELLNTHADILKFGISTPEQHQGRLNYYRVDFKNDVFLVTHNDTVPCYDLHAERLYMDLPYMNFVLTFNHTLSSNDELLINDVVYSNKALLVKIDQKMQHQ